jgi:hypothetical protein
VASAKPRKAVSQLCAPIAAEWKLSTTESQCSSLRIIVSIHDVAFDARQA